MSATTPVSATAATATPAAVSTPLTRYEEKIARIRTGAYQPGDFIIADAKDVDLSGGVPALGRRRDADGRPAGPRTRPQFLDEIRAVIRQDVVDILLASTANIEVLVGEGAFAGTGVLPAFRANDATDIWVHLRGGAYAETPSRPHSGTDLRFAAADLGLYSLTFDNDADLDRASLAAFAVFREAARAAGKRYFLEVFDPNRAGAVAPDEVGAYVVDCIVRTLASLTARERPEFLKIAYHGPAALEELAGHDPTMVVGVLGGGAGTSRDTFELIAQAERHGARLALFGRKINGAEHQPSMIATMRAVADGVLRPTEAVHHYHGELARRGILPDRDLATDRQLTGDVLRAAAREP